MSSPIITAKKLVEKKLLTLPATNPVTPIAWENVAFTAPTGKYLRCTLQILKPNDTCIGSGDYYRENMRLSVYVCDKLNIGTTGALQTAEDIRALFYKRLTMEESGIRVQVLKTPHIAGCAVTADRLVVPISVELTVEKL
jgi:hypothetical protein